MRTAHKYSVSFHQSSLLQFYRTFHSIINDHFLSNVRQRQVNSLALLQLHYRSRRPSFSSTTCFLWVYFIIFYTLQFSTYMKRSEATRTYALPNSIAVDQCRLNKHQRWKSEHHKFSLKAAGPWLMLTGFYCDWEQHKFTSIKSQRRLRAAASRLGTVATQWKMRKQCAAV